MSRKERERRIKKEFILDAARELLFSKGIEETSMEDIAVASEYTRRTLYAYFTSRDEICLLVFLDGLRIRIDRQREAMGVAKTGLTKVRAWGEAMSAFAREFPQYLRLQSYWDYRGIDDTRIDPAVFQEFRGLNEEVINILRAAFEEGKRDGTIRADLNIDMTISQFAYTLRIVLNKSLFPGYSFARFEAKEYITHYLDLFLTAIRKPVL